MKDYATALVVTAPNPASSGTTLVVQTGYGSRFPDAPFKATAHPAVFLPEIDTAEKILVTSKVGDTFTIQRAISPTTAKNITRGFRITNALFAEDVDNFANNDDITNAVAVETARATAAELLKAPLISPSFSGNVLVPVPSLSTSAANKQYVDAAVAAVTAIGSAGGDLTGTYPNPTLATITTAKTVGSSTLIPVITYDAKGRITSSTTATNSPVIADATTSSKGIIQLGGDLAGPNTTAAAPTLKGVAKVFNVKDYGAKGDGIQLSDAAMSSGSGVLTSASASFVSTDVGKRITVYNANAGNNLNTTIASFQSSTQVTLTASATSSVSGVKFSYGTNDAPSIYATIIAANAVGGGIVFYPAGVYIQATALTGSTMLVNNIAFVGSSRGTTTLLLNSNVALLSIGDFNANNNNISRNIHIAHLTFDMNNQTTGFSQGIGLGCVQDVTIDDIQVKNNKSGYQLAFGVNSGGGSYQFSRNLSVSNSTFGDSTSGTENVSLLQAFNCKFTNCTFRDKTGLYTLLNYSSYNVSIVGCHFSNSSSTFTATMGVNGNGTTTITGSTFFGTGIQIQANNVTITGCTFRAYGTQTSTLTNTAANAVPFYGGQVRILGVQNGSSEVGWDSVAGPGGIEPCRNIKIADCLFDGCNVNAISAPLVQDDNFNYFASVTDLTVTSCTFKNTYLRAMDVIGDNITVRDCIAINNNQANSSSNRHNYALTGGNIKMFNNMSVDTQSPTTVTYDLLIDQQASTKSIYPQTQLTLESNNFTLSGIQYYTGSFTTTQPSNVSIYRRDNTNDTSSTYGLHLIGSQRIQKLVDPSAPTVTPTSVALDGITTSGSNIVTSATANFVAGDVGLTISGRFIPASTTITAVNSTTSITISNNATGTSATGTQSGMVALTLGRSGTTTANYYVVAESREGIKTLTSAVGTTTTGFATLSAVNYNLITWTPVNGAVRYYILKNNTTTQIGRTTNPYQATFKDIGGSTTGFTGVTTNNTGNILVDNKVSTTAFQLGTSATSGQVLTTDASGNGTYQPIPVQTATGTAGGDLTGTYPNPTIKASVSLTGTPTAPTATAGTSTTQIATTAFVSTAVIDGGTP